MQRKSIFKSGPRLLYPTMCVCVCISECVYSQACVFVQGEGRHMEHRLSSACVHSTSSPPLLTVSGCLKHSCQWSSFSLLFTHRPVSCVITVHPAFVYPLIWRLHCGAHVPELPDLGLPSPPTQPLLLFTLGSRSVLIYKELKETQLAG